MQFALFIPFVTCAFLGMFGRHGDAKEWISIAGALALVICVARLLVNWGGAGIDDVVLFSLVDGIDIKLRAEPLGLTFAAIASSLWLVTVVYSIGYMRGNNEDHQPRFYTFFALSIAATMGIALAANLVTLFLFYEILTLATYPLVTHHGDEEAKRAGRTYLGILLSTSIGIQLLAITWTWLATGTTEFTPGGILEGNLQGAAVGVLLLMYGYGMGKAALMPLHRWLPAAMVAPTPVSALLHAVAVVKSGVFGILKVVVYIFGLELISAEPSTEWLVWVSGFTIVIASCIALQQDNLKKRLAYSTISQLSYVVMAAALGSAMAVTAAALHILAHAFGKITLFFAAGSIYTAAHKKKVSELDGIGRQLPLTMAGFAIGSLSMIGLPPALGLVSKWYLLSGAFQAEQLFAVVTIILSTALNAAYFLPVIYRAFFKAPASDTPIAAPKPISAAIAVTAGATIILFFCSNWPLAFIQEAIT